MKEIGEEGKVVAAAKSKVKKEPHIKRINTKTKLKKSGLVRANTKLLFGRPEDDSVCVCVGGGGREGGEERKRETQLN